MPGRNCIIKFIWLYFIFIIPQYWIYYIFPACAPIIPYLSIYVKQLGFGSFIVGVLYMILPFTGMLIKPISGAIADKFYCQKKVFLAGSIITAIGFMGIYFLPSIPTEQLVKFRCAEKLTINTSVYGKSVSSFNFGEDKETNCEVILLINIFYF